jgi:arylsulfatase A-like enzyme
LAIRWPKGIEGSRRVVEDYVSFADLAPTLLETAQIPEERSGMQPITGSSLFDIFSSPKSGQINTKRDFVLVGKERHDVGRPNNRGYPIRGIVKKDFLYIRNFETDRWPGGNPETGYLNCDGSPIKSLLIDQRRKGETKYWQMSFGKRKQTELYDLINDPDCVVNLAGNPKFYKVEKNLRVQLQIELKKQKDPRMFDRGFVFDKYPFVGDWNNYYERHMSGKKTPRTGWVNGSDYEKKPLD